MVVDHLDALSFDEIAAIWADRNRRTSKVQPGASFADLVGCNREVWSPFSVSNLCFPRTRAFMHRQLLEGHESLRESVLPAIRAVTPSYGKSVRIVVDNDGNCFGTACLVAAILHAVQNPEHLRAFNAILHGATQKFLTRLLPEQQVKVHFISTCACSSRILR